MWELKACAICLRTEIKLLSMDINNLRNDYKLLSGLKTVKGKGLPEHLCVVCVAYLQRFKKFREKCHRAHYTMIELLKKNKEISLSTLEALNLQDLDITPSLSYLKLENVYYETCKFKWAKHNRSLVNTGEKIPVHHCSTIDPNIIFEEPLQPKVSYDDLVKQETITEDNSLIQETPLEYINDDFSATDHCDPEPETCEPILIDAEKPVNVDPEPENCEPILIDAEKPVNVDPEPENCEPILIEAEKPFNVDPEPENCEPILIDAEKPVNVEENNIKILFDSIIGSYNKYWMDIDNSANAEINADEVTVEEVQDDVDGSQFEEEYARVSALSVHEIKAVVDIYKMFDQGKHKCKICSKSYMNEKSLNVHMRMHDIHTSGTFYCSLCSYYYKTEFLLKTHVADKHMYKYICKKCPEVSFDKSSAKRHYIWTHLKKDGKANSNCYEGNPRPQRKSMRGCKKPKNVLKLRPVRKNNKMPKDFPKQTAVPQLEQYQLIEERKNSRNYLESTFKCQLCYRGFRGLQTYSKHMKKHDPSQSGELQCDMCKLHFPNTRHMYKHMRVCHLFKYSCQLCDYVCYSRNSAHMHYKFHKKVTFKCPHCDMVFNKMSTRLTHIRVKHPSTYICDLCGHSFVSDTGLYFHKKISHTAQEVEASGNATLETSDPFYCADCGIQFRSAEAYTTHFGSSAKHAATNISSKPKRAIVGRVGRRGRGYASKGIVNNGMPTVNDCELCGEKLRNDVAARKHYESVHPDADFLKRYMCDICGHITKQYANLIVHMRTHTQEKPYSCPHCDRKFSLVSNRDRHLVVHTGEKRFQCQHCSRRFTQSSAVKLHIQTVHLKIPYAPWDKKNRKRRKELESAAPAALPVAHKYRDPGGDYLHAYINYNDE